MIHASALSAALLAAAGVVAVPATRASADEAGGGAMAPVQDYEIAIRSEFAQFEADGTIEAYETFIARHPDHPLAEEAKRRIEALRRKGEGK